MSAVQQMLMGAGGGSDPYGNFVSLLLHMDGSNGGTTFIDNSQYPKTPLNVGTTTTSTSVVKYGTASGLFNGVNTQLTYADDATFNFGSSNFTVECWVYPTAYGSPYGTVVAKWGPSGRRAFILYVDASQLVNVLFNGGTYFLVSPNPITTSAWTHIAVVRSGNNFYLFINGNLEATATFAITLESELEILSIGANNDIGTPVRFFPGYIDDLRITKGVARYTASFTPPTSAFPNSSPISGGDPYYPNVSLLLHMDGSNGSTTFTDNSPSPKTATAVGSAQLSTAQFRFGTASLFLDGNSDNITFANSSQFDFGAGAFTVEGFARTDPSGFTTLKWLISNRPSSGSDNGFSVYVSSAGKLTALVWNSGSSQTFASPTTTLPTNQWFHWAFTSDGTTYRLFQDGVQVVSSGVTVTPGVSTGLLYVGSSSLEAGDRDWPGYIDDLRITKYIARYTANFTPPTAAFPNS